MRHPAILVAAVIAIASCATVDEPASKVTVPAAVEGAFHRQAGAAALGPIEREGDRYEASWRDADGRHEVEVAADGRVIEREDELRAQRVPAVVTAALAAAIPDADDVRWVKHTLAATGAIHFEATLLSKGKRRELRFAADGGRVAETDDDGDIGDDDDDDDDIDDDDDDDIGDD